MPKVSVVIPAYNAKKFIRQTIDSVLAQTFRDFEVLVVDDGSKDETNEIVESYGAPVRCIRKVNGGVSIARNTGIANAVGEYVALLDADDLWASTKLEKQVKLLDENPKVGLCFVGMERVTEDLKLIDRFEANYYQDYTEALLLYLCIVTGSCSSAMFRREVFSQTGGFDSSFSTSADWELWLRLSLITQFAPIPEYLIKYRVVSGSMSSNPALVKRDTLNVLNKFFSAADLPRKYRLIKNKSYSNNLMILSGEFLHARQYGESVNCMLKALRLNPQNIIRPIGLPIRWTRRFLNGSV